jgi:uncharacterized protein (DUF433 family)
MATQLYPHVELAANGVPMIAGTQTKVEEIVLDHLAHDWDADEIHRQHPTLSLAEIYSALAYYFDHQAEMDAVIAAGLRQVAELRTAQDASPVRMKLKALGLLP